MSYIKLLTAIFLFSLTRLSAQENQIRTPKTIKGQLIDLYNSDLMTDGYVLIDNRKNPINKDGSFSVEANQYDNSILISVFDYREVKIINIPTDKDTINLEQLPMFRNTIVLVNYGCRIWNPICKYRINRNAKGVDRHSKAERKEINRQIADYDYEFDNKQYKIQYNKRFDLLLIDLK